MGKISKVCLDRVEGEEAILLVGEEQREIPAEWLPQGVKEGDALSICIEIDDVTTQSRKKYIQETQDALRKKSSLPGNLDL